METAALVAIGLIAGFFTAIVAEGHTIGAFGDIIIGIAGSFTGGILISPRFIMDADDFGNTVLLACVLAFGFLIASKVVQLAFRNTTTS